MIYDCFTFFNELDLLEIRLEELWDIVDIFVIVEGNKTFSGNYKELFFEENKEKFTKYISKIRHIVVTDSPETTDPWIRETYQRNSIIKGIEDAKENDYIIISDVDEIPKANTVKNIINKINKPLVFEQTLSYYHLNNTGKKWYGSIISKKKDFNTPQIIRDQRNSFNKIINGGWHFSWIGNSNNLIYKLDSFSHQELNTEYYKDKNKFDLDIENGIDFVYRTDFEFKITPFDICDLPDYVKCNKEKYKHIIKDI